MKLIVSELTHITKGKIITQTDLTEQLAALPVPELADLTDVNATGIADGQVLVWDTTTSKYIPYTIPAGGVTELADLTDVNVTGITDGQVLVWDTATSKYIPADNGSGSGDETFYATTMVELLSAPTTVSAVTLLGYHTANDGGGGVFVWDATKNKNLHNGGTIIDPVKVFPADWNNEGLKTTWFTGGTGTGCWVRLDSKVLLVSYFGAKGDGSSDDTKSIQKAVDTAPQFSTIMFDSNKVYLRDKLVFTNKNYITVDGQDALQTLKTSPMERGAITFSETNSHLLFERLKIVGDGETSGHAGFSTNSGNNHNFITIRDCVIANVTLGIDISTSSSGSCENIQILNNTITNVYGINPGYGYGIICGTADYAKRSGFVISNNKITNCYRHSIYCGNGRGFLVTGNVVKEHRKNAPDQENPRSAIDFNRVEDVICCNNIITDCYTAGIMITADVTYSIRNINISNNIIYSTNAAILVGYIPIPPTSIENITICNNQCNNIQLNHCHNLTVNGNTVFGYILLEGRGGDVESSNWAIRENNIINDDYAFRLSDWSGTNIYTTFSGNRATVGVATFLTATTVTNPNVETINQPVDGLAFGSGIAQMVSVPSGNVLDTTIKSLDNKVYTIENGLVKSVATNATPISVSDYFLIESNGLGGYGLTLKDVRNGDDFLARIRFQSQDNTEMGTFGYRTQVDNRMSMMNEKTGGLELITRNTSNSGYITVTIKDSGEIEAPNASYVDGDSVLNATAMNARYVTYSPSSEIASTSAISFRYRDSGEAKSSFWFKTGDNLFLLVSDSSTGSFNSLRPFLLNLNTGLITSENGFLQKGFTNLGSDAPAIKMKELSGTLSATDGAITTVAHGLTGDKIIGVQTIVRNATNNGILPCSTLPNSNYEVTYDATNVYIDPNATATALTSKPYCILLTYKE